MRTFILLLIFFTGCAPKDKFQDIPFSPKKVVNTLSADQSWNKYSPQIDIMVAFLWPKEVQPENRVKLAEIIQTSRDLKIQKENYLSQKHKVQLDFDKFQCACVINLECTGEEEDLNEEKCYEIEESMYENDRKLISIYGLVEKIKNNVIAIGGEWLKTHLDFRELPNSAVDFSTLQIKFSVLDAYESDETQLPLSYEIKQVSIIEEDYFKRLIFSFKREKYFSATDKQVYGDWTVDAAIVPSEASLLVQGKLLWNYQGEEREGLIYWEHPRLQW